MPPRSAWSLALWLLSLLSLLLVVSADEHNHLYERNDEIVIWANTVGPHANRQETYAYLQLPYCLGTAKSDHHHETLGEALQGMELVNSGIGMAFLEDQRSSPICEKTLTAQEIRFFRYAIENSYTYEMFLDDLPIGGFVGDRDRAGDLYLFTHKEFSIGYNNKQIIEVNLTSDNPVRLPASGKSLSVTFTFGVTWVAVDTPFESRFDKYLDSDFFEHKVHWFSIFNSFMMVIFLIGLVTVILIRTLRRDLAGNDKDSAVIDLDQDISDDFGWKQVHGDVFRSPPNLTLFSACCGTGLQLAIMSFFVIVYSIIGDLYMDQATILSAAIGLYVITSFFAGYHSASLYCKYGGKNWIRVLLVTALMFPMVLTLVLIVVNTIAISYNSTKAIPFTSMLAVISIWIFLIFPLTTLGTIVGRNWAGQADFPCRVNPIPRPIPEKQWYFEPAILFILGGILPFGSIFIEMYFIFTSFWAYKIYYVYGFMLLIFLILTVVSACVTIVATYFLLNAEDHRWHWPSFMCSASTAVYVYIYAIYYFFARTRMYGLFQTSFYFGYTGAMCFGLFVILGAIGHVSADAFVRRIYRGVKID